jgi:hypothetical protein
MHLSSLTPRPRSLRPRLSRGSAWALSTALAATAFTQAGCFFTDEGLAPPISEFYYPTGIAISPGRNALYVINSDFDLQFNAGTVQVVDLQMVRGIVKQIRDSLNAGLAPSDFCQNVVLPQCSTLLPFAPCYGNLSANLNTYLSPGACTPVAYSTPFITAFATIGAFASGSVLAVNPMGEGIRLFVPVRGDPSITWFDVADDRKADFTGNEYQLDCGQTGDLNQCDDEHRMGVDPYDNFRDVTLPVEPVGLDISDDGHAIVSAHQITGSPAVGLSINQWGPTRPSFQYVLSGASNVAAGPSEVGHIPTPLIVSLTQAAPQGSDIPSISYQPGFLVTYDSAAEIDLFRYHPDDSSPPRPYLTRSGETTLTVNASGNDSIGIVADPSDRKACEMACDPPELGATPTQAVLDCLSACVVTPLRLFAANRSPPSLLIGQVQTTIDQSDVGGVTGSGATDTAIVMGAVALAQGPSNVAIGNVIGRDGLLHSRVFAVTFDSRLIYDIDPETGVIEDIMETGRGPHAITFDTCVTGAAATGSPGSSLVCAPTDEMHSYLYVGHFTDSYLGVIDLDMRHRTFGTLFASIGTPTAPLESK